MYIVPLKYSVFAEMGVNYIDFSNFWALKLLKRGKLTRFQQFCCKIFVYFTKK